MGEVMVVLEMRRIYGSIVRVETLQNRDVCDARIARRRDLLQCASGADAVFAVSFSNRKPVS
jgi:hypothetical protein